MVAETIRRRGLEGEVEPAGCGPMAVVRRHTAHRCCVGKGTPLVTGLVGVLTSTVLGTSDSGHLTAIQCLACRNIVS